MTKPSRLSYGKQPAKDIVSDSIQKEKTLA
jgi:hypothetical protein